MSGERNGAAGAEVGGTTVGTDAADGNGPVWRPESRPRLPSKVRVQWNAPRGQALLLYPEGALVLNPTAHAVLDLCDGRRTVAEIVAELAGRFSGTRDDAIRAPGGGAAEGRGEVAGNGMMHGGEGPGEAPGAGHHQRMESDVIAFLERLRQRGWVADVAAL
jgi:pyrroloquinoline quinone biosynthesis protein D